MDFDQPVVVTPQCIRSIPIDTPSPLQRPKSAPLPTMPAKFFLCTLDHKNELKIDVEVCPTSRQDQHTLSALIDSGATTNFIY